LIVVDIIIGETNPPRTHCGYGQDGEMLVATFKGEIFINSEPNSKIERSTDISLSLHPNPSTDIINISGDMGYNERVEIYTLEGVCVHRGRGRRIDVSHLAPGVYFVRVGAESLRFVKM
jgi:hypothetical protein